MEQLEQYLPLIVTGIAAAITSLFAVWRASRADREEDSERIAVEWATPIGAYAFLLFFKGIDPLNDPVVAVGAIIVFLFTIALLAMPRLPKGVEWHYPIWVAGLLFFFMG